MTESFEFAPVLRQGEGWRVGWMPKRSPYCALIGGDTWAFELTADEWREFCDGLHHLMAATQAANAELMEDETLTLERVTERVSLTMTGLVDRCELYVQLQSGRQAEGLWRAAAVPGLVEAVLRLSAASAAI